MLKRKAFTLTELLIALAIVGALAALSIPAIVDNMNRKILANQLKNIALTIQDLAADQMVKNKVHTLEYTDFRKPMELLSKANFSIADADCDPRTDCVAETYRDISGTASDMTFPTEYQTVKLRNGVAIGYALSEAGREIGGYNDGDEYFGIFYVDLNGPEKPNILGRDFFAFRISKKGRFFDGSASNSTSDVQLRKLCLDGSSGFRTTCFTLVERNNWQITY